MRLPFSLLVFDQKLRFGDSLNSVCCIRTSIMGQDWRMVEVDSISW